MDRRTVAFAATVLLSLYVLFAPDPGGAPRFEGADKLVHLVLFALLALTARLRLGASTAVWVAVAAYAVVSELVQGLLLASRSGDPLDVVADLIGVGLGWFAAMRRR